nr:hypothetical protein [Sphingobacterium sp. E70]
MDVEKYNAAKDLEWETMHKARKLALDLGLLMKISDVDYQEIKRKQRFIIRQRAVWIFVN